MMLKGTICNCICIVVYIFLSYSGGRNQNIGIGPIFGVLFVYEYKNGLAPAFTTLICTINHFSMD